MSPGLMSNSGDRTVLAVAAIVIVVNSCVALYALQTIQEVDSAIAEAVLVTSPTAVEARALLESSAPGLGQASDDSSTVVIEVFSNFACEFCRASMPVIDSAMTHFGSGVEWRYRHMPRGPHRDPLSFETALVAKCLAHVVPVWDVAIESSRRPFEREEFFGVLEEHGASRGEIDACSQSSLVEASVWRDMFDAARMGVRVTPTTFVNGTKVEGLLVSDPLVELVSAEQAKRQSLSGDPR